MASWNDCDPHPYTRDDREGWKADLGWAAVTLIAIVILIISAIVYEDHLQVKKWADAGCQVYGQDLVSAQLYRNAKTGKMDQTNERWTTLYLCPDGKVYNDPY